MAIEKVVNIKVQEQGLDEVNAKVVRLENSLDDLEAQNKSLSSSMASSGKSVLDNGGAMGILNELTGGLAMTVKDAVESMDLFTKSTKVQTAFQKIQTFVMGTSTGALKAFRVALISTGIGALIVGVGLLIANFDKVQKYVQMAVDKFKGMGDGIKLLISVIFPFIGAIRLIVAGLEEMGLIDDDVTAKAKKNTELRIKGLESEKNKLTDKYDSEIRLAKAAGKSTVELEEAKRQAILKTLYALNEAERARIKSGDSTEEDIKKWNDRQKEITKLQEDSKVAEIEAETERQNKIKEARDAANQKARDDKKAADEKAKADEKTRLDNIKKINENYAKQIEDFNATTDLQKLELDKKRAEDELNALNASESDKLKLKEFYKLKEQELTKNNNLAIDAINLEYDDKLKELQAVTDEQKADLEEEKLAKEEEKKILELEKLGATEEQKKSIRDYYAGVRLAKEQTDAEKQVQIDEMVKDAKIAIADRTLDLISEIAGKGSKIGKAVAVAQATISGVQGVQNAFTTANASPITSVFPAYPFIQAGLAGAFSLLQIKKIMSTDASGASGASSASASSSGGGGGAAPPSFNLVQGTGSNQIAQGLASQTRPLQAYVVASNVTSQQEMDRNIVESASV